jgi:hypothetical protein
MAKKKHSNNKRTHWHEACYSGIRNEFFRYDFKYLSEFHLSKAPLKIDLLVEKKNDGPIEKNIGRIFRTHNIIEYKSPEDYISVKTLYKTFGYAGLFCNFENADPEQVTITPVSRKYPRALMKYLKAKKNVEIEKPFPGGYYISGFPFPIQIITGTELNPEENIWLASLCRELTSDQLIKLKAEADKLNLSADDYYMSVVFSVNKRIVEEVIKMAKANMKQDFPELYSIIINWARSSDEFLELQRQTEEALRAKEEERRAKEEALRIKAEEERRAKENAIIILKQKNIPDDVIAVAFNTSADEISRLALR